MSYKEEAEIDLKNKILNEINRLGNGTSYLWKVFFLCMTPAILNGLHISSYVFLGQTPEEMTCLIPALLNGNWSYDNIRNISTRNVSSKCQILNWNYSLLSTKTFEEAVTYVNSIPLPNEISCLSADGNFFQYDNIRLSIVPEWNLVCENEVWRTTVQVALSIGKFVGAFLFGILADKFGRKTSVSIGSILYIICGPLAAFATSYWIFIIARVGLGLAGSGVYHSAYTILTELAAPTYRSYMSIFFSVSYPIGMILLALCAYLIHPWRYLQLVISLPALLLVLHFFFLDESPRWLVSKGKYNDAHKIVFKKSINYESSYSEQNINNNHVPIYNNTIAVSRISNIYRNILLLTKAGLLEVMTLYGNSFIRKRLFICHFSWFAASLAYYVLALNGDNLLANQYIYVAVTGLTEIPSYILPIGMFKCMGRKSVSITLFFLASFSFLLILLIPRDAGVIIVAIALFGRTCISSVFAVVILHTAELFPTSIRNSAIGTSSTMAHFGSISAPYIADLLGVLGWYIPTTICGIVALAAGLLIFALPETKNIELYDSIEDET